MKKLLLYFLMVAALRTVAQAGNESDNCQADFDYKINDMLMMPLPAVLVEFTDRSDGDVEAWYWDFGDGQTSNEQNPAHIFYYGNLADANGNFISQRVVTLTILTADSCKSFISDTISFTQFLPDSVTNCLAGFDFVQTGADSVTQTATVQFRNYSAGDSLKYYWKFGNGESSTEINPEVVFSLSEKEYDVCLEISGPKDCSQRYCQIVTLKNPFLPADDTTGCFVKFGYTVNTDIQTFAPGLVLDFYSKTEDVVEWYWDFGDGTTSTEPNPTHIFNLPLDFDSDGSTPDLYREVCLKVTTGNGCEAKWCDLIYLLMNDTVQPEPVPECRAQFKFYRRDDVISIPEEIQYRFVDASEGQIVSRKWEFEDGTVSYGEIADKGFYFLEPAQKVCLSITTADLCESTWCETVYLNNLPPDSLITPEPSGDYQLILEGYFPVWMSSCAGEIKAMVYAGDSLIKDAKFTWSTGDEGAEISGLCPTQTYSVKAIVPDGNVLTRNFIFNADGTITEKPVEWRIDAEGDVLYVTTEKTDGSCRVQWRLCDGTILVQDSVPLELINCGSPEPNLVVTDSTGNVVYDERISLKGLATLANHTGNNQHIQIYPNPVERDLNIFYNGTAVDKLQVEMLDITGKIILQRQFSNIPGNTELRLNLGELKKGIYICKISDAEKILLQQKLVK